ncbi:MAG: SCO family protein [Anaerolineae bacterium]
MYRQLITRIALIITLWIASVIALAQQATPPSTTDLMIRNAWARPADETSAVYLHLTNQGETDETLIAVESVQASSAIHESVIEDDVMRMRAVDGVNLASGETVIFEPGDLHIMLMDLQAPLEVGDTLSLTLIFQSGVTISTDVPILRQAPPLTLPADALTNASLEATAQDIYVGQVINPPIQTQDFDAPSNFEDIQRLSDTNGTWRMIFFGYLHCPDFCPLTLVEYVRVKALIGDDADAITFMLVSVDAIRDTPSVMQTYLNNFDPSFVGLMPDDRTLAEIQPDYGFYYERRMDSGSQAIYTVDHSTRSYLVDPDGILRASFAYNISRHQMASALQWYIEHYDTLIGEQ